MAAVSRSSIPRVANLRRMCGSAHALAVTFPRVFGRPLTTESFHGRVAATAQPQSAPKLPAQSGMSPRASPPSSLNECSQSVRSHLAAHPLSSSEEEVWVTDRLFALLLQSVKGTHTVSSSTTSLPVHQTLHPLLCVRVLQRLGYAVWEVDAVRRKGWSVRHTYPSLGCCSDTAVVSAESTSSRSVVSTTHANVGRVAGAVLAPLLPLLGDGTAAHPPHSHVVPVIPLIVEWLCTLPTPASAVPLSFWLPWVVAVYTEAHGGPQSVSHPLQMPPLLDLLPHLMHKLRVHLGDSTAAREDPTRLGSDTLSERCLASLFSLILVQPSANEGEQVDCALQGARGANGGWTRLLPASSAVDQQLRSKLADVLWWHGEAPLLRLRGVQQALVQAGQTMPVASGALAHATKPLDTPSPAVAAAAMSGSSSSSLVRARGDLNSASSSTKYVPHVTVAISDDDVYRRFLLRLAALQSSVLTSCATFPAKESPPALVSVWLIGCSSATAPLGSTDPRCEGALSPLSEDPDMILRFIQPLHEYVCLLQESYAQWSATRCQTASAGEEALPVQLTFTGVIDILEAVFARLEELKQQSSCRRAAASTPALRAQGLLSEPAGSGVTAFVLLPHKARIHVLKSLCELLLRHVRAVLVSESASRSTCSGAVSVCVPWFADVEMSHQEVALRRLCGAARALVRVVMEERRRSLLEEGPEGSVLTASSVTTPQQRRASGSDCGASTEGGLSVASTLASRAAFERTLRNMAFRVVEPALRTLHSACVEAQTSVPLHVLSFGEWRSYLRIVNTYTAQKGALAGLLNTSAVRDVEQVYSPIMTSAISLFDSVGGRAGLRTAEQVLPHPSQQSISALVEGIRLTALRCFFFDGLRGGRLRLSTVDASAHIREEAAGYMNWALQHIPDAFVSVWHRTLSSPPLADLSSAASEAAETAAAADQQRQLLRHRLGLLTLLIHVRVLCARKLLPDDVAQSLASSPSTPSLGEDLMHAPKWVGDIPSSLDSLLQCITKDSAAVSDSGALRVEWSLVLSPEILQACVVPPLPVGCTALWELVEELRDLSNASTAEGAPEWIWLGSPEALLGVLDESTRENNDRSFPPGRAPVHVHYLLPWTTLAHSHQPWRVYDESGEARRSAHEWASALHSWLTGSISSKDVEKAPSQRFRTPVVRLVSMKEELRFFACMHQVSLLHLTADVRVMRSDLQREEREVAPTVRRVLAAATATSSSPCSPAAVGECSGWYAEEDYDGLD